VTAGSGLGVGGAEAATTAAFGVSVTITAGCTARVANLTFSNPHELTANPGSRSTISVSCTNTAPYSFAVDHGPELAPATIPVSAIVIHTVTATITY